MNRPSCVGIIAEYHPFHNGHMYQIRRARTETGASFCAVFLSSYGVQRGMPSVYDPAVRAEAALRCGADAVFEIPTAFSSSSARDYAEYGTCLAAALGIPYLSFGTEDASKEELTLLAESMDEESPEYREALRAALKTGLTFPEARSAAMNDLFTRAGADPSSVFRLKELLSQPNNILALEYVLSIQRNHLPLSISAVRRVGAGYHDPFLRGSFASATAVRTHILNGGLMDDLESVVPKEVIELIRNIPPLSPDQFTPLLAARLENLLYENTDPADFLDVSPDLADRIADTDLREESWEAVVNAVKTRNYTHTRVSRALFHILFGYRKDEDFYASCKAAPPYARLIGFRRDAAPLLSALKESSTIPIISKAADAKEILGKGTPGYALFLSEVHAAAIWNTVYYGACGRKLPNLYEKKIVIL